MAVDTANRNKSNILTPFLVLDFLRLTYNGDNQHAPKGVFSICSFQCSLQIYK
nr:MAG TPA: hypothetical protein [Bacteriophage sp.]